MKPDWCPQEVWESAGNAIGGWTIDDGTNNQFWACQSSVAKTLLEAEQRGRRMGMEEAAKIAETWSAYGDYYDDGQKHEISAAIRSKMEVQK